MLRLTLKYLRTDKTHIHICMYIFTVGRDFHESIGTSVNYNTFNIRLTFSTRNYIPRTSSYKYNIYTIYYLRFNDNYTSFLEPITIGAYMYNTVETNEPHRYLHLIYMYRINVYMYISKAVVNAVLK